MAGPAWLASLFAGVMLLTAGYCASRLVLARVQQRPTERDIDLVHILMGVAMAGMLAPRLAVLGGRSLWHASWWTSGWAIVFGAFAVWFGWRIRRRYGSAARPAIAGAHHLPHLVMSGAMVYMLVAASGPAMGGGAAAVRGDLAMSGPAVPGVHFPLLAVILAQFMAGYVMWAADRLPALAPVRARQAGPAPPAAVIPSAAFQPAGPAARPAPVPAPGRRHPPLSPRLAACCNIAMGIVMGYMLVIML